MTVRISNLETPCTHEASDKQSNVAMHCHAWYWYVLVSIYLVKSFEIQIFNFGCLSSGYSIFKWSRM